MLAEVDAPAVPAPVSAERVERRAGWRWWWEPAAVGATLLLSAGLNVALLDRQGYGNTYYAAAVKSMLGSWSAFFFAAFDGGGFVTVDKPPVGLWVQAASAWLLGFSGPSLFLPQAVAGVLSVALVYWLVRRAFGRAAGLLAALALAVTPVAVVTDRNNTMDAQLVLVLLLAAWAASLAAERGALRWLLVSAVLVGVGYNIKMLQAYPTLPAFWLPYLLWAPARWRARVGHLALATVAVLAVSLSWSVAVDLTPADRRPFVGSSGSNSALSLALGYNGLGRWTEGQATQVAVPGVTIDLSSAPGFAPGIGDPGLLRLFRDGIADQASWLLPLALVGLVAAAAATLPAGRGPAPDADSAEGRRRRRVALVVWGGWLLVWCIYFSAARFYHLYYLTMLAPAVSAMAGIGVAALWRAYRAGGWGLWPLPLTLLLTALVQVRLLDGNAAAPGWLVPAVGAAVLAAAAALVALQAFETVGPRPAAAATALGAAALLVAPALWSGYSVRDGNGGAWLPQAGPSMRFGPGGGAPGGPFAAGPFGAGGQRNAGVPGGFGRNQTGAGGAPPFSPGQPGAGAGFGPGQAGGPGGGASGQPAGPPPMGQAAGGNPAPPGGGPGGFGGRGGGGGGGALTFAGENWNTVDPALVRYLAANRGAARYLVATSTSSLASVFMLLTDAPAMALGGYQGWDRIVTPAQLESLVRGGTVRFFLLGAPFGGSGGVNADLNAWVAAACRSVPADEWQGATAGTPAGGRGFGAQGQQLYDCAPPAAVPSAAGAR